MSSATDRLPITIGTARELPPSLIDDEVARITGSRSFRRSPRHQTLLRHLVRHAVAGTLGALKEPVLALEVFNRRIDVFDPARDTIVRVEARRLRQRLERYYVDEGRNAPIEIVLPVGSYVPELRRRQDIGEADSRAARDLVERGEYFLRLPWSQPSLELAVARFDAAVRASPRYVPAFVGLGRAWFNLATGWYSDPAVAAENALEALRRAIELDANNAIAHALVAAMLHQFEYDWPAAQQTFERALALAPHQAFVHSAYGYHLMARGALDVAEREIAMARRLDPHYVNARIHMVNLRIAQGRLEHADAELDAMRDVAPESMPAVGLAGLLALMRGDGHAALRHYQQVCELAPDHANAHASLAAAQGFAGQIEAADQTMTAMHARFGPRCVSPYVLAIVATRCGRSPQAFEMLQAAIAARDPNVMLMHTDPSFAELRGDARWVAMLAAVKPRPLLEVEAPSISG